MTPADTEEYFNVTSTAIVTVPKGYGFTVSVRSVQATDETVDPAPVISVMNGNLVITRVA